MNQIEKLNAVLQHIKETFIGKDEIIDLLSSDIRNRIICLKKQIEIDLMKSKNSNNIKSAQ